MCPTGEIPPELNNANRSTGCPDGAGIHDRAAANQCELYLFSQRLVIADQLIATDFTV